MRKLTSLLIILILFAAIAVVSAQEGTTTPPEEKKAEAEVKAEVTKPAEMPAMTIEAQVCSAIEERMPSGMADSFKPNVGEVYLWCKVTGCMDTTVIHHVWYLNGEQMADVELPVKSPSWRTWSSKQILPSWTGDWEVKIVDADGKEMKALPFKIAAE
ncbi:MAG: DUF2914 domain-containing protein [Candidatus Zixiibacteriota bacterium]